MKLNIFRIPVENIDSLKAKLNEVGMTVVYSATVNGWETEFYFSNEPEPVAIPWVEEFSQELASLGTRPTNSLHYGAFIWHSTGYCFALSFGKSHFYLREFCNSEFGLDMARRIGERDDVRQKAARRYAGRRKKEIRSYQRDTQLDVESGESIDYLQSSTIDSARWGSSAKFGTSMLVNPPIDHDALPRFLGYVQEELAKNPLYQLPRIEVVTDAADITRYDQELLQAILTETAEFQEEGHQLVGVEFVFSGAQEYSFRYARARSATFTFLSMSELRAFIRENGVGNDQLFDVKVRVTREDSKEYSQNLKQTLEYSIENERVFLQRGKWVRFNEDYAETLDKYIDEAIELDATIEADLAEITSAEPEFNDDMLKRGYEVADKDFSIIQLRGYKIEAWDLKKGRTVYAVKFGTAQDIGYVCDQAVNVLEIFRNEPATFKGIDLDSYCLWLVLERVNPVTKLSQLKSIISKQKMDAWARKCRELGIRPMVRISRRIKN
jgi:uncharacterized protein (TIGR04141 family)